MPREDEVNTIEGYPGRSVLWTARWLAYFCGVALVQTRPGAQSKLRGRTPAAGDASSGFQLQEPLAAKSAVGEARATAAHWFERVAFYLETTRVLVPGGILVVAEYIRDEASSAAARAVVQFLAQFGEERAYARPAYMAEISALDGFGPVETFQHLVIFPLSPKQFVGLALSSSHARHAVEKLGLYGADTMLKAIGAELTDSDGKIPFGYLFQALIAIRRLVAKILTFCIPLCRSLPHLRHSP